MSLKDTQIKGYKILVVILIISLSVYLGFTPLFESVTDGVAKEVVGSSFGAIFVIILTMFLLNKQTEIEQESKKSEKVFEEKVHVYRSMLDIIKEILLDGKLSSLEMNKLTFSIMELQMFGGDQAINSFNQVFDSLNDIFQSDESDPCVVSIEQRIILMKRVSDFSQKCRIDLGINEAEIENSIYSATAGSLEIAMTSKKDFSKYLFNGESYGKGRLALAVVKHYVEDNPDVSLNELLKIFTPGKNGIAGHKYGVLTNLIEAKQVASDTGRSRYFIKDEDIISIADCQIAVTNQWGAGNIERMLKLCERLGFKVE